MRIIFDLYIVLALSTACWNAIDWRPQIICDNLGAESGAPTHPLQDKQLQWLAL